MPHDAQPALPAGEAPARSDRIYPTTRALTAFIVPFLLLGVYALYLRTDRTRQLWAWEIRSPMSALILASAYAAGAYYFVRATFARRWHHIGRGLLPVVAFAALMGVVTVVHWPLFIHGNIAFQLWAALYFVTPALVVAVWWHNRREDPGVRDDDDVVIPSAVRRVSGGIGLFGLLVVAMLLFAPELLIDSWAWPLTPLTAKVVCVIFILFNVYLVCLAVDPRCERGPTQCREPPRRLIVHCGRNSPNERHLSLVAPIRVALYRWHLRRARRLRVASGCVSAPHGQW